ncbi:hypothetical protein G7Y89_g11447 [Cudoniella acicularis]|uniref:HD domain-containing protein n=1 Tax=Cudoniella acicularis TaxID=354080 RepID=A0A8H4RD76_9HELO|nr:hypothetical protein G7Y89_g11447 [Cudoniella acicularis]
MPRLHQNITKSPNQILEINAQSIGYYLASIKMAINEESSNGAKLPGDTPVSGSSSPAPFFYMLERLKTTKREGWRRRRIPHGESISDHMYRMSLITMFAPQSLSSKINIPHYTKMSLVHDIAEALVGDITPMDRVIKHEKSRREETTIDYFTSSLLGKVNSGITGEEIYDIWREYEDGETLESKFVQDVNKIELVL